MPEGTKPEKQEKGRTGQFNNTSGMQHHAGLTFVIEFVFEVLQPLVILPFDDLELSKGRDK